MKLLLYLQSTNRSPTSVPPTQCSFLSVPPVLTPTAATSVKEDELDLPQYDLMTHNNHYYNNKLNIIYTNSTALDLLYETTIDSTIRMRSSINPVEEHAIPEEWKLTGDLVTDVGVSSPPPNPPSPASPAHEPAPAPAKTFALPREYNAIRNANYFVNRCVEGFTILQAIQFLLQNSRAARRA